MSETNGATGEPTLKDRLYGDFRAGQKWKQKLFRKAAHKSLDIADDDVEITNANRYGIGWKELAVIGGLALGCWWINKTAPPTQPAPAGVADSEYQVRFYDKDGNLITVPRYSPPAKTE